VACAQVVLRPLEPADAAQLAGLFERLSTESRYLRYFTSAPTLPPAHLRRLAAVDHRDHEAVGAFDGAVLVGVAHWFRSREDPTSADLAAEVADAHQRCGLGGLLVARLAQTAQAQGISRFTASVLSENHGVLALLRHAPWPTVVRLAGPEMAIELALSA
jgi:GNAT superfamily N-acetyltransferase